MIVLQVEKAGFCAWKVVVDVKLLAIVDADVGDSELSQPRAPRRAIARSRGRVDSWTLHVHE